MEPQVILYSGGMDSLILGRMFPSALKLYVDTRSAYSKKELEFLPTDVLRAPSMLNLSHIERPDSIVPSRNAYLSLVAANYGDEIMLGATAGDASTDKDEKWAGMMTELLRYMYSSKHFTPREIKVSLPIKDKTKAELVRWYVSDGHCIDTLVHSVSCYSSEHKHCGVCKSCTRKWLALEAEGISCDEIWHTHPRHANWDAVIAALSSGKWRSPVEDDYAKAVLRINGFLI